VKVDYNAIANILTLRYNPARPLVRPLSAADFRPAKSKEDLESNISEIASRQLAKIRTKSAAVLMSAGVDSALTLALLKEFRPEMRLSCVSMGFGDPDDEVEPARTIARSFGCDFEAVVKGDVLSELPMLIGIAKAPRWNLYQYYALQRARSKSEIIFSGDGGDELFGGYTFRYQKYLSHLPEKAGWKDRARVYLACHERDWVPDQEKLFGPKIKFSWDKVYSLLRRHFDNTLSPIDQVFLADYDGKLLYDWIPANAAFSKDLDAQILSIFLSAEMIRFATHMPWRAKYDPDTATGKLPLRSLLKKRGLNIEPVKKGFSVDTVAMWDRNSREIASRYVNSDSDVVRAGVIRKEWVEKTHASLKGEPDVRYVNKMLGILALEVWWRMFVSKNMRKRERL
jgi:asparagine synthase (glutamine-hydrolysing)